MKTPLFLSVALISLSAVASLIPVSLRPPGSPPSVTGDGVSGGGEFADGSRYVLFLSDAGNLVTNDIRGGVLNVFRRDLSTGHTELVSVDGSGRAGRQPATEFSATPDGRRVAFTWSSDDGAAGDTNHVEDVYVRDFEAATTRLVSVNRDGTGAGNGFSSSPVISGNGRWVVFESVATDLVDGVDTNRFEDIFLRDLEAGTTELISRTAEGAVGDRPSRRPLISGDGSVVVFSCEATNVASLDGYGTDLVIWTLGGPGLKRVQLPGIASPPLRFVLMADNPVLSADGRYLAFSVASGSSVGTDSSSGVWWMDLDSGRMIRASGVSRIPEAPYVELPSMSADGRTLAFAVLTGQRPSEVTQVRIWTPEVGMKAMDELQITVPPVGGEPPISLAPILSPDASALLFTSSSAVPEAGVTQEGEARLYHRVLATGVTRWISGEGIYFAGGFSADGSRVVFESQSPVLPAGDDNDSMDVVTMTIADGSRAVVSLAVMEEQQQTASGGSVGGIGFSDDGRFYGFMSSADNVISGDTNQVQDGFVFDRVGSTNRWVDVVSESYRSLGRIQNLVLARGGHHAAFVSNVEGLTPGDTNRVADVFVRDLESGTTDLVSAVDGTDQSLNLASSDPHISADGRWVAFLAVPTNPLSGRANLYLRDRVERRTFWINPKSRTGQGSANAGNVQMSADGLTISFNDGVGLYFVHGQEGIPGSPLMNVKASYAWLSADGRALVALTPTFSPSASFFYQRVGSNATRVLLSGSNLNIRDLKFSADASVVTYVRRTDPAGAPAGNPWQVWALSLATGTEELISVTPSGQAGQGDSRDPQVSADGRFIVFRSATEDLVAGDDNGVADIFVRDRYTGVTTLLSRSDAGILGNGLSTRPEISGDGRFAAFTTFADNLLPGDGNGLEDVTLATIPREPAPDTDGDGLPDGWERDQFGSLTQDGAGDADGDGATNAEEFAARTAPTDSTSRWRVALIGTSALPALQWTGHAGVEYVVERRENLEAGGVWVPMGEVLSGHEGTMEAPLDSGAFYRVTVR